jgi:hypothetical protein
MVNRVISFIEFNRCLHIIANRLVSCYSVFEQDRAYSFQSVCKELYISKELTKTEMRYMIKYFLKINMGDRAMLKVKSIRFILRQLNDSFITLHSSKKDKLYESYDERNEDNRK